MMALFATCSICGKKKLAFLIDDDGICSACETKILEKEREEKRTQAEKSDEFDVSSFIQPAVSGYTPPPASSDEPVYVVIDVETTGFSPTKDAIVQVSALRFFGNKAVDGLNSYVNPLRPIPRESTAVHGITDDKVKDSPTIDDIKEPFMNLVKGAILVGHNVTFDLNFLDHAFHGALDGIKYIDTMRVAKTLLNLPNYRLETVADYAEFHPEGGYHDSLTDCTATAAVFFRLAFDKPGLAKVYRSQNSLEKNHPVDPHIADKLDTEETAPYMEVIHNICQEAGITVNLHSLQTDKGFDIVHNMYIWFRVKLSGKLNYLLVPMPIDETKNLLYETNLEVTAASKSETPQSHCRIMLKSLDDFRTAAPVITACIREYIKWG